MNNVLRGREVYEDFFHDIICYMLPKFKRSNIRPTYQKNGGKAGNNRIVDGKVVAIDEFTNGSNFIYLTVLFDDDSLDSYTYEDGTVDVTRRFKLKLNIYGNQSQEVALIIRSLFRLSQVIIKLESSGIYLESTDNIVQMNEIINGEPWERRDLTISFNENVKIPIPEELKLVDEENIVMEVVLDEEI